jgi:hypothetical protein
MIQARLRFRHWGCFSERLSGASRVLHLSSDGDSCIALLTDAEPALMEDFAAHAEVIDRSPTSVTVRCSCARGGVVGGIQRRGGTVLWPVLQRGGLEFLDVLAPSREALRKIVGDLRKIGEVEVERVTEVEGSSMGVVVRLPDITSALSGKQLKALRAAIEGGYYETPRRVSTRELAAALSVSPSTFQEHLRKAQAAIMTRFAHVIATHPGLLASATKGRGRPRKARADPALASGAPRPTLRA